MRIFDVHVHIYPDKIAMKASESIGVFYDGIRMHGDGTLSDCLRQMDEAGVEKFAAHSVALTPHNVESINRFIMGAHALAPERILPFAAIHPDMEDMEATVKDIVEKGFRRHQDPSGHAEVRRGRAPRRADDGGHRGAGCRC